LTRDRRVKDNHGEDAKEKVNTMRAFWVPGVNNLGSHGRWAFGEFTAVYGWRRSSLPWLCG
jgi:type III restriction enzyme